MMTRKILALIVALAGIGPGFLPRTSRSGARAWSRNMVSAERGLPGLV